MRTGGGELTRPADPARPHSFGLDLVRATAIALVLVSHAGGIVAGWCGVRFPHVVAVAGTFGVELFFVLSGFLVGRILLRTLAATPDLPTLARFLARRCMRTLPLYWAAIAALLALQPPEPGAIARDAWRYATFTQNLLPPQIDLFFPVSWTLSVEEWFYAGFSVLLLAGARVLGGRRAFALTLLVFLAGPPIARLALFTDPAEYRIVPFWLDAIGYGVLAAAVATWRPTLFARAAAFWPAALALTAFFWADETARFLPAGLHRVAGFAAIAAALALLLPAATRLHAPQARPTRQVVRWLSERSYGIYITHVTVLQLAASLLARWGIGPAAVLAGAGILLVPELTWRAIEKPMIDRRPRERAAVARRQAASAMPRST